VKKEKNPPPSPSSSPPLSKPWKQTQKTPAPSLLPLGSKHTLREISKALSNIGENLISKTDLVSLLGAYNRTFILQIVVENIYIKAKSLSNHLKQI